MSSPSPHPGRREVLEQARARALVQLEQLRRHADELSSEVSRLTPEEREEGLRLVREAIDATQRFLDSIPAYDDVND